MFQSPNHSRRMSVKVSEVLNDIGVNKKMVLKRRRAILFSESMSNARTTDKDKFSLYKFGSQSEGTTTIGLQSDIDRLYSMNDYNVIQDWSEWEPGVHNYLMIQDETVSPGHCLLQRIRDDAPLPCKYINNEYFFKDREGRILLKNTFFHAAVGVGEVIQGPALSTQAKPGFHAEDNVGALPCKSWPIQARNFLCRKNEGKWLTEHMMKFCVQSGCFTVGVGSKVGCDDNEELEWRISTSLAERCLMFNLSMTQIKCYVLMKMIKKTFIDVRFADTISSFMCKTVLLHCITYTEYHIWRKENLLVCLRFCLAVLYKCVSREFCPHFIIPGNNLMTGKIVHKIKPYILEILYYLVNSDGRALLVIECDDFGRRLQLKVNGICDIDGTIMTSRECCSLISGNLVRDMALNFSEYNSRLLSEITSSCQKTVLQLLIKRIITLYNNGQRVCRFRAKWLCSTLGSVLASFNIYFHKRISPLALTWISLGLNLDVSSSKLKLASMFFCSDDIERTAIILTHIEYMYDRNVVEPICNCYRFIHQITRRGFNELCHEQNEEAIKHATAFCVSYLPCEINCVPKELRYEMYRSSKEDIPFREERDFWMDWAVVDSLPFMYFLQYKTNQRLGRQREKSRSLSKLFSTITTEPNLGHRETALNLLGQCLEQEEEHVSAFRCYMLSLKIRGRNNAAIIHICRLLSAVQDSFLQNNT